MGSQSNFDTSKRGFGIERKMSSLKVVDIMKACKQSRMDQALGLSSPRNRFGGAVKSSNMTPPWGTSAPWSSSETNSETNSSSSGPFNWNWNSSNAARYEQGTTFYSQVRQGK